MEDNIISRREFFRKTIKKTLPILIGVPILSTIVSCEKDDDELLDAIDREENAVLAHHVVHHVAADAIQVVKAVRHLPLAPVALIAVVVDAIQDVVEDVRAVAPLTVKEVVVQDVQAVVVHHALEPAKKVARHLVQANVVALHVQAFVQTLVTEDSVMEVVLAHVNHPARVPAFIRAI